MSFERIATPSYQKTEKNIYKTQHSTIGMKRRKNINAIGIEENFLNRKVSTKATSNITMMMIR